MRPKLTLILIIIDRWFFELDENAAGQRKLLLTTNPLLGKSMEYPGEISWN